MREPSLRSGEPEWDQLSIDTPELVAIEMPVAGLGSRFVAVLVDYLLLGAILLGILIAFAVVDSGLRQAGQPSRLGRNWTEAVVYFALFLLHWGYFTLFEAFWQGRTPGKRVARIRVIQASGRGIGLFESMTRNLLRAVDWLPALYVAGVVSILVARQHQRLGDLAAGTLVVHERETLSAEGAVASTRTFTAGIFGAPPAEDAPRPFGPPAIDLPPGGIQRLTPADLEVLEGFFARRLDFSMETRAALAERVAAGIRARSGLEPPANAGTETFLEEVARQLRDLSRVR